MTSSDSLPEPVRRYLSHAVPSGESGVPGVRLTMSGRIKIGIWLPFIATQRCDGKSFLWRASVGLGPLRPLEVTDRYEDREGSMSGKLLGRWVLFEQTDANVVRSAAARTALEAVFAPRALLPGRGYAWRAESDDHIVASAEHPPEHVEVHLRPGDRGLELRRGDVQPVLQGNDHDSRPHLATPDRLEASAHRQPTPPDHTGQRRSAVRRPRAADTTVVEPRRRMPFESGWSMFRAALGAPAFSPVPGHDF